MDSARKSSTCSACPSRAPAILGIMVPLPNTLDKTVYVENKTGKMPVTEPNRIGLCRPPRYHKDCRKSGGSTEDSGGYAAVKKAGSLGKKNAMSSGGASRPQLTPVSVCLSDIQADYDRLILRTHQYCKNKADGDFLQIKPCSVVVHRIDIGHLSECKNQLCLRRNTCMGGVSGMAGRIANRVATTNKENSFVESITRQEATRRKLNSIKQANTEKNHVIKKVINKTKNKNRKQVTKTEKSNKRSSKPGKARSTIPIGRKLKTKNCRKGFNMNNARKIRTPRNQYRKVRKSDGQQKMQK